IGLRSAYNKLRHILRDDMSTCDIANMNNICNKGDSCPPCWIKNGNKYDCYNYTSSNSCPFPGMIDRKRSKHPASTCLYGNQLGKVCDTKSTVCPPCWKKEDAGYSCFAYVNGNCPFGGMIDITKS
ncbi:hypothetical protein L0F63_006988, partial [Massospora cicadina]